MSGLTLFAFGIGLLAGSVFLLISVFVSVAQGKEETYAEAIAAVLWLGAFLGLSSVAAILFAGKLLGAAGWL